MIQEELRVLVEAAVAALAAEGAIPAEAAADFELTTPARREHGDFSTNAALALAGAAGRAPRELAEAIIGRLPASDQVTKVEVAGPGFINFFLSQRWLLDAVREVAEKKESYGWSDAHSGVRMQVEYGSANPTGPLHVGNARNIAYGDALASLLETVGYNVERENYLNDAGAQMDKFARSLEARYLQALGKSDASLPEDGYAGTYLVELGRELAASEGMGLIGKLDEVREWGLARIIEDQRKTLERFGVVYDRWMSERSLHRSGKVTAAVERLTASGHTYEAEGAVWFRATGFGHSKDKVLVRSVGEGLPTYLAADIAYLLDKVERGYERVIYLWGADHHGYVESLLAAAKALGVEGRVEFILYQFVNFMEGGQPARMSKRTGALITLDELLDEVGADAARFTFLTRSPDSTMDFDFEFVKSQSQENPVYYVQYAHARIASILRYAESQSIRLAPIEEVALSELAHESERELMRALADFPTQIEVAASLRAPYRIANYAQSLAALFHAFYRDCRVISDDLQLTQARLWLSAATRQVLANALKILGVGAPERM
jgi:arginyl-tRNA synthetase